MKKRTLTLFVALLFAAIPILTLPAAVALAEEPPEQYTEIAAGTTQLINGEYLAVPKGITVVNAADVAVSHLPAVTYTFTVAPIAPPTGAVVNGRVVKRGAENSVTAVGGGQVTIGGSTAPSSPSGTLTQENIYLQFHLAAFTEPAVYRYLLRDVTDTQLLFNAGIVRHDDYKTDRFLDVYVAYDEESPDDLVIIAFALLTENAVNVTSAGKSGGFINGIGDGGCDRYTAVSASVKRTVSGTFGNKSRNFLFTVEIDNLGQGYSYLWNGETLTSSAAVQEFDLSDNRTFLLLDLNPKATVKVSERLLPETTGGGVDPYLVTVQSDVGAVVLTDGEGVSLENVDISLASDNTVATAVYAVSDYDTVNGKRTREEGGVTVEYYDVSSPVTANGNVKMTFVNHLEEISPTGVVMYIAPYILLLAAGIVLFVIGRKKTKA